MTALLEARGLGFGHPGHPVGQGVSLALRAGSLRELGEIARGLAQRAGG